MGQQRQELVINPAIENRPLRNKNREYESLCVGNHQLYPSWHLRAKLPQYRVDGIKLWQRSSTYRQMGPARSFVAFSLCTILAGLLVLRVIADAVFIKGDTRGDRVAKIARAVDCLCLFWISLLSLCVVICCADVFCAQGIWLRKDAEYELGGQFRRSQDFKTGRWFLFGAIPGSFALLMLIATCVFKLCCPQYADHTPWRQQIASDTQSKLLRFHSIDHLKYISLVGIVLAHFWLVPVLENELLHKVIFTVAMSFCVSSFAFASGYNAPIRATDMIPRRRARILVLAVVYFLAMILYILFFEYVAKPLVNNRFDKDGAFKWLDWMYQTPERWADMDLDHFFKWLVGPPWYQLWYLQALILWLLLAPIWMTLRFPFMTAVVASCIAMHFIADDFIRGFPVAMPLEFFPYFVAGACIRVYGYDHRLILFSKDPYTAHTSGAVLAILLAFSLTCPFNVKKTVSIFGAPGNSIDFKAFDRQRWYSLGRAAYIISTLSNVISILLLVPNRMTYFSRAARRSIVPFVFHYFLVLLLCAIGFYGNFENANYFENFRIAAWKQALITLISIIWTVFLFHPPVADALRNLIMPPLGCMFTNLEHEIDPERRNANKKKRIAHAGSERVDFANVGADLATETGQPAKVLGE